MTTGIYLARQSDNSREQTAGQQAAAKPLPASLDCLDKEVRSQYEIPEQVKFVPLTVHRILPEKAEFGGVYQEYVEKGIAGLNKAFKELKLQFYLSGLRNVQDNDLFNRFGSANPLPIGQFEQRLEELAQKNSVENTINIFILPEIDYGTSGMALGLRLDLLGQQHQNQVFISYDNNNRPEELFPHEIGHIFGLLHPHDDLVPGNKNCERSGDFLCDTPPDPAQYNEFNQVGCQVDSNCQVVQCGDSRFMANPPLGDNMMSYYHGCKRTFTAEQRKVITCNAQRHKANLLQEQPQTVGDISSTVRVRCDAASAQSIQEGVDTVIKKGGGTVQICGGTYYETISVSGLKSTSWFNEKYAIRVTIEAAQSPYGEPQPVVIDAGRNTPVMQVVSDFEQTDTKERQGRLYLTVRNLAMINGLDRKATGDDMTRGLFDFSYAEELTLEGVTISQMESHELYLIFFPSRATVSKSTFANIEMDIGSLFFSTGWVTIENCIFRDNSFVHNTRKGPKPGPMFFLIGEKDADTGYVFSGTRFERNQGQAMLIVQVPEGDSSQLSPREYQKRLKQKILEATDLIEARCSLKQLDCKKD